jgi:homoserine kinase
MHITIRVPATSANLGPGFDSLGLALDLWNETVITLAIEYTVQINGEGAEKLSPGENNLIIRSAQKLAECVGKRLPPFHVDCINRIPLSSGLGSSAAAKLTGLLGANKLLSQPLSNDEILDLAAEMEGHSDNVASALLGGLVVSTLEKGKVFAHKINIGIGNDFPIHITIVLPDFHLPTKQARAALPQQVSRKDAVHNISRAVLVTEAFRNGDMDLLGKAMTDTLHQPYRLSLIPGAQEALDAAKRAGASAVALSGAGPSLIAFSAKRDPAIGETMTRAFEGAGLSARTFPLRMSNHGAEAQIR